MIKRTKTGYMVTSEGGKPLSKRNLTKAQARKRLQQVEYFNFAAGVVALHRGWKLE